MSTGVIGDSNAAVMYCNTTNMAFGPVHTSVHGNARDDMLKFVSYVHDRYGDPRKLSPDSLKTHLHEFMSDEEYRSAMWV